MNRRTRSNSRPLWTDPTRGAPCALRSWSILVLLAILPSITTLSTASSAAASEPLDVVFVLDNSGSMKANDPGFLTRQAVLDFAATLAEDSEIDGRIGLVLFDERARLAQPLTAVDEIIETQALDRALRELDFSGQRTHSPAGIERGLYELRDRGRDDASKAIVLLSDGRVDTGDASRDLEVTRWLKDDLAGESEAEGIRIFGIAFTDDADYQLMQALARRTRARYYRAFEADELPTVVADVLATVDDPANADLTSDLTYDLAYIETPDQRSLPLPPTRANGSASPSTLPDVASSPLRTEDRSLGTRLLGWLPVALLLVGGAYYWRRRSSDLRPLFGAKSAPAAQLLDPGGLIGDAGGSLPLNLGRTTIGRDPSNDIVLADDTISSEQAAIEVRDGRYWLIDLRSTNGTRHGDRKLARDERVPLKGGDHVRFADIDLMFVLEGYVPGGATVYLASSTTPPADWSTLAERTGGHRAPGENEAQEDPRAVDAETPRGADDDNTSDTSDTSHTSHTSDTPDTPDTSDLSNARDARSREIVFAEHRERIDPASVLDLDEELGEVRVPPESNDEPDASLDPHDTEAIERAEAVLAQVQAEEAEAEADVTEPPSAKDTGPRLALLADPEDAPTAPTEIPRRSADAEESTAPSAWSDTTGSSAADSDAEDPEIAAETDSSQTEDKDDGIVSDAPQNTVERAAELRRCLGLHLERVAELSPAFASFVERAFQDELRDALPVAAGDLLRAAAESGHIEQRSYTFDRVRYLICAVPGSMESASERFGDDFGGFTRVLTEELNADSFRVDRCEILAVLSFGAEESPWVSLTIVPDEGQDPRIDLLSYEFLTESERQQIEPSLDHEISQSGLA